MELFTNQEVREVLDKLKSKSVIIQITGVISTAILVDHCDYLLNRNRLLISDLELIDIELNIEADSINNFTVDVQAGYIELYLENDLRISIYED